MNKDFELYKDYNQANIRIDHFYNSIINELDHTSIDYINKISGSLKNNDDYYSLRNSITLRLDSVLFHHQLFESINKSGSEFLVSSDLSLPRLSMKIALQQDFLFDSIIFHTVSLFDYLSCLIKFLTEKNKQDKKEQWSKLVSKMKSRDHLKELKLAKEIIRINDEWTRKLIEYRSELIHYKDDVVGDSITYNDFQSTAKVDISAPANIFRYFKQLKIHKEELNFNNITYWIIITSLKNVLSVLKEIRDYIDENRKTIPGNEITFKNKNTR